MSDAITLDVLAAKFDARVKDGARMSSDAITFTVPGKPQGKARHRACIRAGRIATYAPSASVRYERLIATAAGMAMRNRAISTTAVRVEMEIMCPVPTSWPKSKRDKALAGWIRPTTKPDVDNVIKAVLDGANGIVWRDDVLVVEVGARKWYSASPGVRVWVAGV